MKDEPKNSLLAEAIENRDKLAAFKAAKMEEMKPLEARLRDIHAEREKIKATPVDRESMILRAHAEIDEFAESYLRKIVNNAGSTTKHKNITVDQLVTGRSRRGGLNSLSFPLRGSGSLLGDFNSEPITQEAATFLFADALKLAARRHIEAMHFPRETDKGIFIEEAEKRLAELDAEEAETNAKMAEITAEIEQIEGVKKPKRRAHVGNARRRNYGFCEFQMQARDATVEITATNHIGSQSSGVFTKEAASEFLTHLRAAMEDEIRGDDNKRKGSTNAKTDRDGTMWRHVTSEDTNTRLSIGQKAADFTIAIGRASTQVNRVAVRSFHDTLRATIAETE